MGSSQCLFSQRALDQLPRYDRLSPVKIRGKQNRHGLQASPSGGRFVNLGRWQGGPRDPHDHVGHFGLVQGDSRPSHQVGGEQRILDNAHHWFVGLRSDDVLRHRHQSQSIGP